MKRILFGAILASLALPGVAFGADLPVKAIRAAPLPLFYGGSGVYWLAETGAEQTKLGAVATVGPVAATNLSATGGNVGLGIGYTRALGADSWLAVEGKVNATNADATVVSGIAAASVKRRYSFDLDLLYGAPLSRLGMLFSNSGVAFGALPTPCTGSMVECVATNVHPFVIVGAHYGQTTTQIMDVVVPGLALLEEKHSRLRWDAGVGALVQINNSTVWRSKATWTWGSGNVGAGFLLTPGANLKEGGTFTATTGMAYAFNSWF